jgi:hypothetical protein
VSEYFGQLNDHYFSRGTVLYVLDKSIKAKAVFLKLATTADHSAVNPQWDAIAFLLLIGEKL